MESNSLEQEHQSSKISPKQIVALLNQKIKLQEQKTKDLEKAFYKEQSLDLKDFTN